MGMPLWLGANEPPRHSPKTAICTTKNATALPGGQQDQQGHDVRREPRADQRAARPLAGAPCPDAAGRARSRACRLSPSRVSSGKNSQPWRRDEPAGEAGRPALHDGRGERDRARADVRVDALAGWAPRGAGCACRATTHSASPANDAGEEARGPLVPGGGAEDLLMGGVVAQEPELGDDHSEGDREHQLEPGVRRGARRRTRSVRTPRWPARSGSSSRRGGGPAARSPGPGAPDRCRGAAGRTRDALTTNSCPDLEVECTPCRGPEQEGFQSTMTAPGKRWATDLASRVLGPQAWIAVRSVSEPVFSWILRGFAFSATGTVRRTTPPS